MHIITFQLFDTRFTSIGSASKLTEGMERSITVTDLLALLTSVRVVCGQYVNWALVLRYAFGKCKGMHGVTGCLYIACVRGRLETVVQFRISNFKTIDI